jgi:hypothetical protein
VSGASSARADGRVSSLSPAGEQKQSLDRLLACEFTTLQTAYNRIERHAKRPCANIRTVLIAISLER